MKRGHIFPFLSLFKLNSSKQKHQPQTCLYIFIFATSIGVRRGISSVKVPLQLKGIPKVFFGVTSVQHSFSVCSLIIFTILSRTPKYLWMAAISMSSVQSVLNVAVSLIQIPCCLMAGCFVPRVSRPLPHQHKTLQQTYKFVYLQCMHIFLYLLIISNIVSMKICFIFTKL